MKTTHLLVLSVAILFAGLTIGVRITGGIQPTVASYATALVPALSGIVVTFLLILRRREVDEWYLTFWSIKAILQLVAMNMFEFMCQTDYTSGPGLTPGMLLLFICSLNLVTGLADFWLMSTARRQRAFRSAA